MQPIGVLGGTFDPVHFGHLRSALEVREALGLAQLRLIPCRLPPHRDPPVASAAQRLAMLEAAIAGEPGLHVDRRELDRPPPSYTVDTLRSLRTEFGAQAPLCLLLGQDAFRGVPAWHRWELLIELAHFIVLERPQPPERWPPEVEALLEGRRAADPKRLAECPAGLVLCHRVTQLDISATRIRDLVASGSSPRYLLPDAVWAMILEHGLYAHRSSPAFRTALRGETG